MIPTHLWRLTTTAAAATPTATTIPAQPTSTHTNTPTPSSPLVVQCEYPDGWRPYIVVEDDTVYALALKSDTSTRLLLQANCIGTTEDIKTDTTALSPTGRFCHSNASPLCLRTPGYMAHCDCKSARDPIWLSHPVWYNN